MVIFLSAVLAFAQTPPPNSYLRTKTEHNGVFSLQTGAHRLSAPNRPDVWLVGAAHIGTRSYYTSLQQLLDVQGEVLFEGVKQSQKPPPDPGTAPNKPGPSKPAGKPPKPVYQVLSDALGLDFQLVDINYAQPNWVDSDLSMDELNALNKAASPGKPTQFDMIGKMLDPSSPIASMMSGMISQLTPGMRAGLKLFLVKQLSMLDPAAVLSDPATKEVILTARNKSVESYVTKYITSSQPPFSVAVFYGAMHQQDIEKDLTEQYGYKVVETRWFTAATADTHKVDAQGQMVYNLLTQQFSGKPAAPAK